MNKKLKIWKRFVSLLLTAVLLTTNIPVDAAGISVSEDQIQLDTEQETDAGEQEQDISENEDEGESSEEPDASGEQSSEEQYTSEKQPAETEKEEEELPSENADVSDDENTSAEEEPGDGQISSEDGLTDQDAELPAAEADGEEEPEHTVVHGTIKLPEGAYIEGGSVTGTLYIGSVNSRFTLEEKASSTEYTIAFNSIVSSVPRIYIRIDAVSSQQTATNLATDKTLYYTGTGWEQNSGSAVEVSLPQDGSPFDVTLPTAKLYGKVKLPEEGFVKGGSVRAEVYAYYKEGDSERYSSANAYINAGASFAYYSLPGLPLSAESLTKLRIRLYGQNSPVTNLALDTYEYFNGESWVTEDTGIASPISFENGKALDITPLTRGLYGQIKLPAGGFVRDGDLSVSVYAYVDGKSSYSANRSFTIPDVTEADGGIYYALNNIPFEAAKLTKLSVYVRKNNAAVTNLILNRNEYYDGSRLLTSEINIAEEGIPFNSGVLNQDLTLRRTPVSGTISLPKEVVHEGGDITGKVYVQVYRDEQEQNYDTRSTDFKITAEEVAEAKAADKAVSIDYYITDSMSADISKVRRLYVYVNNINGNAAVYSSLFTGFNEDYAGENTPLLCAQPDEKKDIEVGEDKSFNLTLRETAAHVNLSLAEEAQFGGGDLKGRFCIEYPEGSRTTTKNKSIVWKENEKAVDFYINDALPDISQLNKIYVNWESNDAAISSNFMRGRDMYYNGITWQISDPKKIYSVNDLISLEIQKSGSILNTKLKLPAGTKVQGERLSGTLTTKADNNKTYSTKFVIVPGSEEVAVQLPLPEDSASASEIKVRLDKNENTATNLLWNTDLYYDGTGVLTTDSSKKAQSVSLTGSLEVSLVKAKSIGGNISLPEGAYVEGQPLKGTVYVYTANRRGYSNKFSMPLSDTTVPYMVQIPYDEQEIKYIRLYVDNVSNQVTNVLRSTYLYYTEGGWSKTEAEASPADVTGDDTTLDLAFEKTMSLNGTVSIPENAFLDEGGTLICNVTVRYTRESSSYSSSATGTVDISSLSEEGFKYHVILLDDAKEITGIEVRADKRGTNGTETNIYTGTAYVGEEGRLTTDRNKAVGKVLESKETSTDILLLKVPSVSGIVCMPEGVMLGEDVSLKAYVNLCYIYGNNSTGSLRKEVTLNNGSEKTAPYRMLLPIDAAKIQYMNVRLQSVGGSDSKPETNLELDKDQYCDMAGGWYSRYQDVSATDIVQPETKYDITLPIKKQVAGKILLPEGGYFSGGDYKGKIEYITEDGQRYGSDFIIPEGETETDYAITLSSVPRGAHVCITSANSGLETNVVQTQCYTDGEGNWNAGSAGLDLMPLEGTVIQKDITLECVRTLKGMVKIPEGISSSGTVSGRIEAKVNGGIVTHSFSLYRNLQDFAYTLTLPVGARSLESICVTLSASGNADTNLLLGSSYYSNEDKKWGHTYMQATAVPLDGIETTLDIELMKAVNVTGTLSLASGSYFKGADLNGYVRVYADEMPYVVYYTIPQGSTSYLYKVQIPVDTVKINRIQVKNYANSLLDTDVMTGMDLYWKESGWVSAPEDGQEIQLSGESIRRDLTMPQANIIMGNISLPEGVDGSYEGQVFVISGHSEFKQDFSTGEKEDSYRISLPPEEAQTYKLYYKLDMNDSPVLALGSVYVNADGSYDVSENFAPATQLHGGINRRDIKLALWSDFESSALIESDHPYAGSEDMSASYTYPGSADSLTLHFSKYTEVENNFDDIFIYGEDDTLIGQYTGTALAGQDVKVPGKMFKIVLSADANRSFYGYAIESITPENGVLPSEVATSLIYKNEEPSGIMIHNGTDGDKVFYMSNAGYEDTGKMLELETKKLSVAKGMASASLAVIENEDADKAKLMLYDEDFTPLCEEQYKAYPKYSITYKYNDEIGSSRIVYLPTGELSKKPASDPAMPGYRFAGWYEDEACSNLYTFGQPVRNNITLYAKWNKSFKVTVETVGEGNVISEQLVDSCADPGEVVTITAGPKEGWVFTGWSFTGYDPGDAKQASTITFAMPSNDVFVTATFKRKVDIEWISTSVQIEGKEVTFDENGILYVPKDHEKVSLSGKVTGAQAASVQYTYKYYGLNADGEDDYIIDADKEIELAQDGSFSITDLLVGVGTNSLIFKVTIGEEVTELTYRLVGENGEMSLKDGVTALHPDDIEEALKIKDLATGIVAYWDYDGDDADSVATVLIVKKDCEIGKRLMLPEGDVDKIGIGSIWIIPACDQFAFGYSFEVADFGDANFAPRPPEGDIYEGQVFGGEQYLYILASEPDVADVFDDAFSFSTYGVDGVAFSILPENTVMECSLEDDMGNVVTASAGDMMSSMAITEPGFQYQNLLQNIVPKASINASNKVTVGFTFGDTVLYDKDGSGNTTWDQISLGGGVTVSDLGVESVWEYHPKIDLRFWRDEFGIKVLPDQVGLIMDYTETKNFKLSVGGTIGGDPKAKENAPTGQWSLKEVVSSFQKKFGCDGGNTKKKVELLGQQVDIKGNDMSGTIVLAAVGFNLATLTPVASANYEQIAITSTFSGFTPILALMLCLDVDGSVSAKICYTYSQSTYNAKGFNIESEGFAGTNAHIASLTPVSETNVLGYHIEQFDTTQASKTNTGKPAGKHTITATGEVKVDTSFGVAASLLMCGLNIAQLKGGLYARAGAGLLGSVVLEKDKKPDIDFEGWLTASVGLFAKFNSRLLASAKFKAFSKEFEIGNIGFEAEFKKEWELMNWSLTSFGCTGIITEPTTQVGGKDTPLSDVKVTLTKKDSAIDDPEPVFTDADGKYSFKNLSKGEYRLKCEKDGYKTEKDIKITISDKGVEKDVSLSPAKYMQIKGTAVSAEDGSKLSGVSLLLKKVNDGSSSFGVTNANGEFTFGAKHTDNPDNSDKCLTQGVYKITASKAKYKSVSKVVSVTYNNDEILDVGEIQMAEDIYGNGKIEGKVLDLATGRSTGEYLEVTLYKGMDNTMSEPMDQVTVGTSGEFSFEVPAGTYTIVATDRRQGIGDDERYHQSSKIVNVQPDKTVKEDIYVSQAASDDQIRIKLTWGATPSDLDSHLLGPTGDGSNRFHTFYSNKAYMYNNQRYADLDLDDTSSYGPETTTIYKKSASGVYRYYIHDYSNRGSSNSTALANSGATVEVYVGSALMAKYKVPSGGGTVWHVFDYEAGTGTLTPGGEMMYQSDPGAVGYSLDNDMADTQRDVEIIYEDLEEK